MVLTFLGFDFAFANSSSKYVLKIKEGKKISSHGHKLELSWLIKINKLQKKNEYKQSGKKTYIDVMPNYYYYYYYYY